MLSREDNERITRVGPGTPMGNLMRRYWIPAAISTELEVPNALPHIFVGVKNAAVLAVIGAIVGEWVGGGKGIGVILIRANIANSSTELLAGVIYIASAAVVLFLIIELIERVSLRWYYESRAAAERP